MHHRPAVNQARSLHQSIIAFIISYNLQKQFETFYFIEALQTVERPKDKWVAIHDRAMFNLKDFENLIRLDRQ